MTTANPTTPSAGDILELLESAGDDGRDIKAKIFRSSSVRQLIESLRLSRRPHPAVSDLTRRIICELLGVRQARSAIFELLDCLENDESMEVRREAADALFKIGHPKAGPALLRQFETQGDFRVRAEIATALGRCGYAPAVPQLILAARHDQPALRGGAIDALGRLLAVQSLPLIHKALSDGDSYVRAEAARALERMGAAESARFLRDAVEEEKDKWAAKCMASALSRLSVNG